MVNVLVELRPAWRNYWVGFVLAAIFLALALASLATIQGGIIFNVRPWVWLLASLVVLAWVVFRRYCWKFTVNSTRVSRHYGLISRNQQSIRIKDLRGIELDQSLFQRLFGTGNLSFYTAGSATAEVTFLGIKDPDTWRTRRYKTTSFRSEEHTSELQSRGHLVCRLLLVQKKVAFTLSHLWQFFYIKFVFKNFATLTM